MRIEVDLKRPGRVDVNIPLFPTTDARESFDLLRMLCEQRQVSLGEVDYESVREALPLLITPGAAETLAMKVYRIVRTESTSPLDALKSALIDYKNPVPLGTMQAHRSRWPSAKPATSNSFLRGSVQSET